MQVKAKLIGRFVFYILFGLIFIAVFFFAVLQTPYAKHKINSVLTEYSKKHGLVFQMEDPKGYLPFSCEIPTIHLLEKDTEILFLENIKLSVSPWALLKGNLVIQNLDIEKAIFSSSKDPSKEVELEPVLNSLTILRTLCIHQLFINSSDPSSSFYLYAHYSPKKVHKFLIVKAAHEHSHSSLDLSFHFNSADKYAEADFFVDIKNTAILSAFVTLPLETALSCEGRIEGPLTAFSSQNLEKIAHGEIAGTFKPLTQNPQWEKEWGFRTYFGVCHDYLEIKEGTLENEAASLQANGAYHFQTKEASYTLNAEIVDVKALVPEFDLEGGLHLYAKGEKDLCNLSVSSSNLFLSDQELNPLQLEANFVLLEDNLWAGTLHSSIKGEKFPIDLYTKLTLHPFQKVDIDSLTIKTPSAEAKASGALHFAPLTFKGACQLDVENLADFSNFFAGIPIDGKLQASLSFSEESKKTIANVQLKAEKLRWKDRYISLIDAQGLIENPFEKPLGSFRIDVSNFSSTSYHIDELRVETNSSVQGLWPFSAEIKGNWRTPFFCEAGGSIQFKDASFELKMDRWSGKILAQDFFLEQPVSFSKTSESINLSPLEMTTSLGSIHAVFNYSPLNLLAEVNAQHIPLELLSFTNSYLTFSGQGSITLNAKGSPDNLEGSLRMILENADLLKPGDVKPKETKGTLEMHVVNNHCQAFVQMGTSENESLNLQATLPVHYAHAPFSLSLDKANKVAADIRMQGRFEELFDFIDLGPNRLSGLIQARLLLANTLEEPFLQGTLELSEGSYESYNFGTYLKDLHFKLQTEKNKAKLIEFYAVDQTNGSLKAEGEVLLNFQKHFPYSFILDVNHLQYLDLDMITATFSGPVYLSGNTENLNVRSNLLIDEALYQLNDQSKTPLPELDVEFIHQPKKVHRANLSTPPSLPFSVSLDAELSADSKVFVNGKGLNSEWKGHILIKETPGSVHLQGTLSVIKGEYLFSGKRFKIQEGSIYFNEDSSPFVNVKANVDIGNTNITLQLQGPLSQPSLTFTSMPPLPTSSILSYILFNKDISEISPVQAILLAKTLVDISNGSESDLLDKIRMRLGVDRLDIVSDPNGGDQVSLQIGKYLARGVLVTLSQSTASSNIIVEVDLKHGFVFQAESQDQDEGKFTLKWHHNY